MRLAWFGTIQKSGGVGGVGNILLEGLLQKGIEVDYYDDERHCPIWLCDYPNFHFISVHSNWEWNRWYSRNPFLAFVSGSFNRVKVYNKCVEKLVQAHSEIPYDFIFQLSQTELFSMGKYLEDLPPLVVYPCVHAAGELFWHKAESSYALQSENFLMHYLVRGYLTLRTFLQKREIHKPRLIIGMSRRFNELISRDYQLDSQKQAVLYHPIPSKSQEWIDLSDDMAQSRTIVNLLFVARISVRKGLQYIVELSHRLEDLSGKIQIFVIGGRSQWSDYTKHLSELNPKTSRYLGYMGQEQLNEVYKEADVLLLPSLYEPGGIVVGESLAKGMCVVVSDAVGSAEVIQEECVRSFSSGDMDDFENEVRQLIQDLQNDRSHLRILSRQEATNNFEPSKVVCDLVNLLSNIPQ
jgi:glycosyltransferase involved in cell wall biosynthesis